MDDKYKDINALLNGLFSDNLRDLFDKRLHELDTNQTAVQELLKITYRTLNGILDGTSQRPSYKAFKKVADFLRIPVDEVLEKHSALIETTNLNANSTADKKKFIRENFDLVVLKKSGFIKDITDFDAIEKRITSYFGLNSITEYKRRTFNTAFMAGAVIPKNTDTRDLWLSSAKDLAMELDNRYYYDRHALIKYFPQIRWHSTNVEYGLINVIKTLFKLGITVIFQPSFSTLHLRGATFAVDGQPCIALPNYRDFYATLWHCLIHELYHVLFDWDEIKNEPYRITEDKEKVLSIDPKEEEADSFAREYMFSKSKLDEVSPYIWDTEYIKDVAQKNNVEPSTIYVYYAYENGSIDRKAWARARRYSPNIKKALNRIEVSWEDVVSIKEVAKKLKLDIYN